MSLNPFALVRKQTARPAKKLWQHKPLGVEQLESRITPASLFLDHGVESFVPGETAVIIGSGFAVGETIQLQVLHTDGTANTGNGHAPWSVTDGGAGDLDGQADGSFQTTWYVDPDDSLESSFEATAVGLTSTLTAQVSFLGAGHHDEIGVPCGDCYSENEDVSLFAPATQTLRGNYVAAGVGMRNSPNGSITISGIPSGSTIRQAYLYWGALANDVAEREALRTLTFAGNSITGTVTGTNGDTCWGRTNSHGYRANVTSLVSGNGTYAISNMANSGGILRQGASLVVVYENAAEPWRTVQFYDGNDVFNFTGSTLTNFFGGFTATGPVSAKTTFIIGDGQSFGENVSFNGSLGGLNLNNSFEGGNGLYWDTDTYDVSSRIGAGSTSASATVTCTGDCLMWVAQVFSVTVASLNTPPVANNGSATTAEDTAIPITLSATDTDPLTYTILTGPTNGTLTGTGANRTYTPNSNYNGADSFTFKVNDGQADSNTATFTITVTEVNDAPTAVARSAATNEDVAQQISVGSLLTGSGVIASSTFDTGDEGWRVGEFFSATGSSVPTYVSSGGNPGGFVRTSDIFGWNAYHAPSAFLGNKSAAYGGNLHLDLKVVNADNVATNYPVAVMSNGTLTLQYRSIKPGTNWTSFDIPLVAGAGWELMTDGYTIGASATAAQIQQVLSNLTFLHIDADWFTGGDQVDLDNVRLEGPGVAASPGPANESSQTLRVLSVAATADTHGTVVLNDNGTPTNYADDFVVFTPAANYFGPASFKYSIQDNGTTSFPATASLLVNGDFEAAPILGSGQSGVAVGSAKWITTTTAGNNYEGSISGINGWAYALPGTGGHSDHGLARQNASFGLPSSGQSAFINNWNRMVSQTVSPSTQAGDTVFAAIDFGTLGSNTDNGRAGRFYLVAGGVDPNNKDNFAAGSIILDEISVANLRWTGFVPDVVAPNGQYVPLHLSYTFAANDPALGKPLTIAFRTVTSSVGPTYWDNAKLFVASPTQVAFASAPANLTATATVSVNVASVNDAPSFTKGADQTVLPNVGPQTIAGWATNLSKGPANESVQVLDFIVSSDNPGLFAAGGAPAISPTGTLTYTPHGDFFGTATVTVRLHDNGGTANGGVDTSNPQTFTITVTPVKVVGGDLYVVGRVTQGDTIDIGPGSGATLPVVVNGQSYTAGAPFSNANVFGLGGNDQIALNGVSVSGAVSIQGGDANDTATLSGVTAASVSVTAESIQLNGTTTASAGGVTLSGPATLISNSIVAATGNVGFAAVDGEYALTVNTSGTTTFGGAVGQGTALAGLFTDAGGSTVLSANVNVSGNTIVFNDAVVLAANVTITDTGAVTFVSTLDSDSAVTPRSLTVSTPALTTFGGAVGTVKLAHLTTNAGGTTAINGGSVSTTGDQSYGDAVTLGAATTLEGANIGFGATVNGGALTVNSAGTTSFAAAVSTASLSTDAGGTTGINGGSVTTTGGDQTYGDAVTLGSSATLGGSSVSFASSVSGAAADLTVNATTTTFGGAVATASLTTDADGTTALNGTGVTTSGNQSYGDAVTVGANVTLEGGNVSFAGTVSGGYGLAVNSPGTTTFAAAVNTASLTTNGGGTTAIYGNSVTTTGLQSYHDAVTLGVNITLNGSTIDFLSTVDGAYALTVTATTTFGGAVGATTSLASLNLDGTTNINGGSVRTTGSQVYDGPVTLGANTTISTLDAAADVTFESSVTGPSYDLFVACSDATTFNGDVTVRRLVTDAPGATYINGNVEGGVEFTTTADISFYDRVFITNDVLMRDTDNGTGIFFFQALDGVSGFSSHLRLIRTNPGSQIEFHGPVGETPLSSLRTYGPEFRPLAGHPDYVDGFSDPRPVDLVGRTLIAGGLVSTIGDQIYYDRTHIDAAGTEFRQNPPEGVVAQLIFVGDQTGQPVKLAGGEGTNSWDLSKIKGSVKVNGGGGDDVIKASDFGKTEIIVDKAGAPTLIGGKEGSKTEFQLKLGDEGAKKITLKSEGGQDKVSLEEAKKGVVLILDKTEEQHIDPLDAASDTLKLSGKFEEWTGTKFKDVFVAPKVDFDSPSPTKFNKSEGEDAYIIGLDVKAELNGKDVAVGVSKQKALEALGEIKSSFEPEEFDKLQKAVLYAFDAALAAGFDPNLIPDFTSDPTAFDTAQASGLRNVVEIEGDGNLVFAGALTTVSEDDAAATGGNVVIHALDDAGKAIVYRGMTSFQEDLTEGFTAIGLAGFGSSFAAAVSAVNSTEFADALELGFQEELALGFDGDLNLGFDAELALGFREALAAGALAQQTAGSANALAAGFVDALSVRVGQAFEDALELGFSTSGNLAVGFADEMQEAFENELQEAFEDAMVAAFTGVPGLEFDPSDPASVAAVRAFAEEMAEGFQHVLIGTFEDVLELGFNSIFGNGFEDVMALGFDDLIQEGFEEALQDGFLASGSLSTGFEDVMNDGFVVVMNAAFGGPVPTDFIEDLALGFQTAVLTQFDDVLQQAFDDVMQDGFAGVMAEGYGDALGRAFEEAMQEGFDDALQEAFTAATAGLTPEEQAALRSAFDAAISAGFDDVLVEAFETEMQEAFAALLAANDGRFENILNEGFNSLLSTGAAATPFIEAILGVLRTKIGLAGGNNIIHGGVNLELNLTGGNNLFVSSLNDSTKLLISDTLAAFASTDSDKAKILSGFNAFVILEGDNNAAETGLFSNITFVDNGDSRDLYIERLKDEDLAFLSFLLEGSSDPTSLVNSVRPKAFMGLGNDIVVGGLLGEFEGGGGDDVFFIEDPTLIGVVATLGFETTYPAIFKGGLGSDQYRFVGEGPGKAFIVELATDVGADTINLSSYKAGGATLDLAFTGEQQVGPGLSLTLSDGEAIENLIGTALADTLYGNGLANQLSGGDLDKDDRTTAAPGWNGRTQVVYLDFSSTSAFAALDLTDGVEQEEYNFDEQVEIKNTLEDIFAEFHYEFYILNAAGQPLKLNAQDEVIGTWPVVNHLTVFFNRSPDADVDPDVYLPRPGGHSNEIDLRNVNLGGLDPANPADLNAQRASVEVDINGFLGGPGQPANDPLAAINQNAVDMSAILAAHEIFHNVGGVHSDSQGPPAYGIHLPPGPGEYLPPYPGPVLAFETAMHIIASPASVGTSLFNLLGAPRFGERELIKLAFNDSWTTSGPTANVLAEAGLASSTVQLDIDLNAATLESVTARSAGELVSLNVPNTMPRGINAGKTLDVFAKVVTGTIGLAAGKSESDFFAFKGRAGDLINLQVISVGMDRLGEMIDPVVRVYGADGNLMAYYNGFAVNDDDFDGGLSNIVDLVLPNYDAYADAAGNFTFYVEVDTFSFQQDLDRDGHPDFATIPEGASQDAIDDTDVGNYELFIYRFSSYNTTDGNDTIDGRVGNDVLAGGTGDDIQKGGDGDDFFLIGNVSPSETDTVTGGAGRDSVDFRGRTQAGITLNLATVGSTQTVSGDYKMKATDSLENAYGTKFNDTITGNSLNNLIVGDPFNIYHQGSGGDDVLVGGDGDDVILGHGGNDDITGGNGNDVLVGGFGADRLVGSNGHDILIAGELVGTYSGPLPFVGQSWNENEALLRAVSAAWAAGAHTPASDLTDNNADNDISDTSTGDKLTGAGGADWFILGTGDTITENVKSEDLVTTL